MSGTSEHLSALRCLFAFCGSAVLLSAFVCARAAAPGKPPAISAPAAPAFSPVSVIDPTCKVVLDAAEKALTATSHEYMARKDSAGKVTNSEVITIDGARYLLVGGKWTKSKRTLADAKTQEEENIKNAKVLSCKKLGDETVNGEAATIYTEHEESDDATADAKLWISKSKGLILKEELNLDTEDHWDMRFEYSNVHAPM